MTRKVAVVFGSVTSMLVLTSVVGGLGDGAMAKAAGAGPERHAPMIPAPGPPGLHAATAPSIPLRSANWSGYAISGTGFTSVTGQWTVPTVTPPARRRDNRFSSTWVGIDGYTNDNLIQAGTEQDWWGGAAHYYAWWEILPAVETELVTPTIHPGDTVFVSIAEGVPSWTITVSDETSGQSSTTLPPYSGPLTSAEWIQEAPLVGCCIAHLAHDSTIDFTEATANGLSAGLVPADSIEIVRQHKVISVPSPPAAAGNAFAVAYGDVPPSPP